MVQSRRFLKLHLTHFWRRKLNDINRLRVGAVGAALHRPAEGAPPCYSPVKTGRCIGAHGALPKGRDI